MEQISNLLRADGAEQTADFVQKVYRQELLGASPDGVQVLTP